MFRLAALFALLGLAAATGIIVWNGYGAVLQALGAAGWGILWTSLYHLVPLFACVVGWRALLPGRTRLSHAYLFYVLWLRAAVNNLMPVARIGGEVVSVRVMMKQGVRKNQAISSTIVELTLSLIAVFLFVIGGVFLLALRLDDRGTGWKLAAMALAILPLAGMLLAVQRIGFYGILNSVFKHVLRDTWKKIAGDVGRLDRHIPLYYRRRGRILYCFAWQLVSWSSAAGEIWLGLYFLGAPHGLSDCFIFEALLQGASSAAFAVPGALGVQEAGFVFFGHLLGVPADTATALAVMRRCRDLILFLPGLIVWQVQEGHWFLSKHMK